MEHSIKLRQIMSHSPLCLLALIGATLLANPAVAQVFDLGPSDSTLFDTVINLPPDPNIGQIENIGGDGSTTQLNVFDGGSVGGLFRANSDAEVNVSGGTIGSFFGAEPGSEVNISGGSISSGFSAEGSVVNISDGSINGVFSADAGSVVNIRGGSFNRGAFGGLLAFSGSEVNLVGTLFILDGAVINDSLSDEDTFTIVDRDVTLSGRFDDGTAFSFDLTSNPPVFEPNGDYFDPNATLTVKLSRKFTPGDANQDGFVTFLDIDWFIGVLSSGSYLAEADINQDGDVNFLDIDPLIELLRSLN